jgi:hypothetical protein
MVLPVVYAGKHTIITNELCCKIDLVLALVSAIHIIVNMYCSNCTAPLFLPLLILCSSHLLALKTSPPPPTPSSSAAACVQLCTSSCHSKQAWGICTLSRSITSHAGKKKGKGKKSQCHPINQVLDLLKNQILQWLQGTKELIREAAGALNDAGDIVLSRDERRPSFASTRHSSQTRHAAGCVKGRE